MGRISRAVVPRVELRADSTLENPSIDLVQALVALTDGTTVASVSLTPAKALRLTAVYACVRVIAESLGSLPVMIYQQGGNSRSRVQGDDRGWLLNVAPNPEMTAAELLETWLAGSLLWGRGYMYIDWLQSGQPGGLWPLRPDKTRECRTKGTGQLYYTTEFDSGETKVLQPEQVIPLHSILKISPIRTMREAVAGAIAAEEYASRLWANNARPGGAIEIPGEMSDEKYDEFRRRWRASHEGLKRSQLVGILTGGAKWVDVGIPPQEAQMIEARQFGVREIARMFRVPPHVIGDLEGTVTRASIEQQSIEFVTYSLRPWLVRAEQQLRRALFAGKQDRQAEIYPEFQAEALMRGDTASRFAAWAVGIQWGFMSRAEAREREGWEVAPDDQQLDDFLVPLNMASSGNSPFNNPPDGSMENASALAALALIMRNEQFGPDALRFLQSTMTRQRELEAGLAAAGAAT